MDKNKDVFSVQVFRRQLHKDSDTSVTFFSNGFFFMNGPVALDINEANGSNGTKWIKIDKI